MLVKEILQLNQVDYVEKAGDYIISCLNPDHIDTHPSLRVDVNTGKFHCFSCGFKGNIFAYFGETPPIIRNNITELISIIDELKAEVVPLELPMHREPFVEEYRGISGSTYAKFNTYIDFEHQNRLNFPIYDSLGTLQGILTRRMHSELKSGKYIVYPAKKALPIYPLPEDSNYVILVEGMFDMLNLVDKGMENISVIFGTHTIGDKTLEIKLAPLVSRGVSLFLILLDNDKAGSHRANILAKEIHKLGYLAVNITELLPEDKDPGELSSSEVLLLYKKIRTFLALEHNFNI